MNHSYRLLNLERGSWKPQFIARSSRTVGNLGTPYLWLASEAGGGLELLPCGVCANWVSSVKIELNCRPPRVCLQRGRIARCGKPTCPCRCKWNCLLKSLFHCSLLVDKEHIPFLCDDLVLCNRAEFIRSRSFLAGSLGFPMGRILSPANRNGLRCLFFFQLPWLELLVQGKPKGFLASRETVGETYFHSFLTEPGVVAFS